jgi:glucokinase
MQHRGEERHVVTVGLDLGGENIHALVLDHGDEVRGSVRLKTPTSGDRTSVLDVLEAALHAACGEAGVSVDDVEGVGVGTPGVVIEGTVGGASNVPGFLERFGLADLLEQKVDRRVRVVNDVTAAAVAEHRLGAGRGVDHALAVFVGTGVGGGLVLDGDPYLGASGGAGEFGHMVVQQRGAVCPCGRRGCVEAYAGRRAMTRAAERAHAAGRATVLFDVQAEMEHEAPTTGDFQRALARGDDLVADLIDGAVGALGTGIASAVNLLDVELVVLGGELADHLGEQFRLRVDAAARPLLFLQPPKMRLVAAQLGHEAGAMGAALLGREA